MEEVVIVNNENSPIKYERNVFDQLIYDRTMDNIRQHQKLYDKLSTRNLFEWIFRTIVILLLLLLNLHKG